MPNAAPVALRVLNVETVLSMYPAKPPSNPPTIGMCCEKSDRLFPPLTNSLARPVKPPATDPNKPPTAFIDAWPNFFILFVVFLVSLFVSLKLSANSLVISSVSPRLLLYSSCNFAAAERGSTPLARAIFSIAAVSFARVTSLATPSPPTLPISTSSAKNLFPS